jgi:hypothetical protein
MKNAPPAVNARRDVRGNLTTTQLSPTPFYSEPRTVPTGLYDSQTSPHTPQLRPAGLAQRGVHLHGVQQQLHGQLSTQ